ncbi:MAG: contractile injection system tape measure protein [Bacteroidales bacterium]
MRKIQLIVFLLLSSNYLCSQTNNTDLLIGDINNKIEFLRYLEPNFNIQDLVSQEIQEVFFIKNAGLIILSPYLETLFEKCGLTINNEFIDKQSIFIAVRLLEYAAIGKAGSEENELVINKLLCGLSVLDTIVVNINLSNENKEIVDDLLNAVIQHWTVLGNTSIDGLRLSFLQREGRLEEHEEQYNLNVEQKAYDTLLDHIPWSFHNIGLKWMEKNILVEWR